MNGKYLSVTHTVFIMILINCHISLSPFAAKLTHKSDNEDAYLITIVGDRNMAKQRTRWLQSLILRCRSIPLYLWEKHILQPAVLGTFQPELIVKYGYPAESHTVVTEDGYILTLHRIPYGKNQTGNERGSPVLVQHGVFCSSADWILMGPGFGLGYMLADAGYDVWMGSLRGSRYARRHLTLNPNKRPFWQFSFHEMGVYDLPAMIDYITNHTGGEKLYYIGHSSAAGMFYVMGSERPEYNNKIRTMTALGPFVFSSRIPSVPLRLVYLMSEKLNWLWELTGSRDILPIFRQLSLLGSVICKNKVFAVTLCNNALFLVFGFDPAQLDTTMLSVIYGHHPTEVSSKSLTHFGQSLSGQFRQYDYGWLKNKKIYGRISPPEYSLSNNTVPVAMFYGKNDLSASVEDVKELYQKLPNKIGLFEIGYPKFNHIDFMWGLNAPEVLYSHIIEVMRKY